MPRYELWEGWSFEHRLGSRDMETGSLLDVFLFLSSSPLLFFGSRPSTNVVGTGFYNLPMEVEFPRAPDPPKGRH